MPAGESVTYELVGPEEHTGELVERRVELTATDEAALLATWLDELLFLADTEGLVPESAELVVSGPALTGVVRARLSEPRPLVKAVTLHRLAFWPENGLWKGRVVLDV